MALTLYYHPFSSHCCKSLIHLCEAGTPVALRNIDARLLARTSVKRAVDDARPVRVLSPGGAPNPD